MYVWDPATGALEQSLGVYAAGRTIITKSGVQCEADEDAKLFEQAINGN